MCKPKHWIPFDDVITVLSLWGSVLLLVVVFLTDEGRREKRLWKLWGKWEGDIPTAEGIDSEEYPYSKEK